MTAFNSRPCEGPRSTSSNRLKLSSRTKHALWNRVALRNSRSSVAIHFILSVRPLIDSSCTPFPHAAGKVRSSKAVADPYLADLFETITEGNTVLRFSKDEKVFAQGVWICAQ